MAFVPVLNTVMAELRFLWDGQRVENTLYFESDTAWAAGNYSVLAEFLENWWFDNLAARVSQDVSMREVFLTDLTSATHPTFSRAANVGTKGARISPALPNSVSLAISFRTAGRGRSSRGRNYIMGMTEDQVSANTFLASESALYITGYQALLSITLGFPCDWVVVSRFTNGAPRVTGVTEPVTSVIIVDNTVDSQRRRLPGRGS